MRGTNHGLKAQIQPFGSPTELPVIPALLTRMSGQP